MLYLTWLFGLLRRRKARIAVTIVGIAVPVAFVAVLAGFFADTRARMTDQAVADVAIDWQVQLAPGADAQQAIAELARSPKYAKLAEVGYADTPGLEGTSAGTVQTTGSGKVLGLQSGYERAFPSEIRTLVGQGQVMLAQQTAANLHAQPGSVVSIKRPGLPPVDVTIDRIVDLPLADALFQPIGAPLGAAPQAPPDNVVLLPLDQWHQLFDAVAQTAPEAIHTQLHVGLVHNLPADPSAAFTQVQRLARNYETRLAGAAIVGDNLAARLDAARSDALYAEVLFLFLGLPGVLLCVLLTAVLISSGSVRRRREQALLRLRGASIATVMRLASIEALCIGIGGSALGLALATLTVRATFGRWAFANGGAGLALWSLIAGGGGMLLALAAVLIPAWNDARSSFVQARTTVQRTRVPLWERLWLDVLLLLLAGLTYWLTSRSGYQVVVAPEGAPRVSISYSVFSPALFLWLGASLFIVRLARVLLANRGRFVAPLLRPIAHRLSSLIAASMSRQRVLIAAGVVLVALSIAFAASTAVFNATYRQQARVEAELTNGADVTVTGPPAADLASRAPAVELLSGVTAVEPMQHRFAYVGSDLQDLYGVQASSLSRAARLSDAFFAGMSAKQALAALAANQDGVLVSAETVRDFQLQKGDLIRLRLQNAQDHQYHVIAFHYLGVAREFPTAPTDSFLVANSSYIAQQTGSRAAETLLIRTSEKPASVAAEVRKLLGPTSGATVRDLDETRRTTNSSLTAVSLSGITRVELALSVGLAVIGSGLVFALGLEERRRTLAIVSALGAKRRQLGAFVWSEAMVMLVAGWLAGIGLGWQIARMLVKLLTGVFDPPPEHLAVPWFYLMVVTLATVLAMAAAAQLMTRLGTRTVLVVLRSL